MKMDRRQALKTAGVVGTTAAVLGTSACGGESEVAVSEVTVPVSDVPVGSGVVVEETFVVTQPTEGDFHAFSSICPHQGCQVRDVTPTEIICPCHSTRFDPRDGHAISGATKSPLAPATVTQDGETLKVRAAEAE